MSAISICSIDFDISSTENGMLHKVDASKWLMTDKYKVKNTLKSLTQCEFIKQNENLSLP